MRIDMPRVLIVDDDPVSLKVLTHTLEKEFFLVIARGGLRALELAKASPPDCILLDILMPPGPDGFEVCRRLKEIPELTGVPVIFLSIIEDPEQKQQGFDAGGVDYVTKPFHAAEVLARVRTHITNKRLREELERHNANMGQILHETSRQLENLMNNLPGLVYRGRADAERSVRFVSQGALRLTGYAPEYFVKEGLASLIHPDDREAVLERLNEALVRQERFELTYRAITADGVEKWVNELGSGVLLPEGPCVEGFISDVTERQKQQYDTWRENQELRERLKARCAGDLVGASREMSEVFDLIAKASAVEDNVVIYGETGTGKELTARAIHQCSARYHKPFVAVNCGAIPETLFESEFFGYKKGAFTGALTDKKGYLDLAEGGTLFLDEVGEISLPGQVKLLRAIESGGFTPVGGSKEHSPDVRVIAATNRDLSERVADGSMRSDFYYRIHVIPINLPPLRHRKTDIPLLVQHFLKSYPSNKREECMEETLLQAFMLYDWPGNVRELQNVLYQYLSLGTARLGTTVVGQPEETALPLEGQKNLALAVAAFERAFILNVLRKQEWRRGPTAEILGLNRRTLFRKMKEYSLGKE